MTSPAVRIFSIVSRLVVAGACCLGIWSSWKVARADSLFQQHNEDAIRAAIRLQPDAWRYYTVLSQVDPEHEEQLLMRSLQLDPYNAPADIELGLYTESSGDYARAEKFLLEAYSIDRTFNTRWALANFYFRRGDEQQFWKWARMAASMPSERMGALFELCWHQSDDPDKISAAILTDNPDLVRQYIDFLVSKNQLVAASTVAPRLIRIGNPRFDTTHLLALVNRLSAAKNAPAAAALWRQLIDHKWVEADSSVINNPSFTRDPLEVDFDWHIASYDGLHSSTGPSGLQTEFTGSQPESCVIASQSVILSPGTHTLRYSYRTVQIPPGTGLKWQIITAGSTESIADSPQLSSDSLREDSMTFTVPPGASLMGILLSYQRTFGTPRISGHLVIQSVQIQ